MSKRIENKASQLDFFDEHAPQADPSKKKRKKQSGKSVFKQALELINKERGRVYPERTLFLDYGDGYEIVVQDANRTEISPGGERDGIPRVTVLSAGRVQEIDAPDNVRRLAFGIKRGMNKKKTVKSGLTTTPTNNDVSQQERGRRIPGTTIVVFDGENHDQAFPNMNVDMVNRSGMKRMAAIAKSVLNKK